ncbi:methyl-accepting chemotaxis protein [Herbaspirillum sp. CF444]|uniref:methyl-accepting chemotaxis protein n=1 Tax=Herbaspirillum sp. CF444 TaxID=1144319 RepID=UPI000272697F|nr:methyl-accepting chemotaxis protein [Herbaspirillum sp. CF444]EJL80639.1 methyl-accepting chemotaxis protein [Herbaspirillum sp. CF444]
MHHYFRSIRFKLTLAFLLSALILFGLGACAISIANAMAAEIDGLRILSPRVDAVAGHGRHFAALMTWIAVACMIAGAIVALLAARHLIVVVCGGLHRQTGKFGEMASFLDFSKRSASPRKDEFGTSARAFDGFLQRVEDVVVDVAHAATSVATATREIAAGNMDLSIRTEQQAASLEQTAHSMRHLTDAIRSNTDNALRANELTDSANALARSGSKSMQTMSETIGRLDQSSKQISEITALIDGIAFQTNILALNAAVEAARAGAQGRGFAVVASEVRNLAHRSSAAAKEIKALIDASVGIVQVGLRQAHEVNTTVDQVQQSISAVSDIVNAISAGSIEQRHGIEKIGAAIAQMDQTTQQNAAMVEQVAAAAQSLEEQAGRLKQSVSAFKVSDARLHQLAQAPVALLTAV